MARWVVIILPVTQDLVNNDHWRVTKAVRHERYRLIYADLDTTIESIVTPLFVRLITKTLQTIIF